MLDRCALGRELLERCDAANRRESADCGGKDHDARNSEL